MVSYTITLSQENWKLLRHIVSDKISLDEILSRKFERRQKTKEHPDVKQMKQEITQLHDIRKELTFKAKQESVELQTLAKVLNI